MTAKELLEEQYPEIVYEDKWDWLRKIFSADDMIHFAEEYSKHILEHKSNTCYKQTINLLKELREIYLLNADADGHPKAKLSEIVELWNKVNELLKGVKIK
jgi:hypothetical protein